mmetsp:Transcript_20634/g.43359  ORF Transcript_20634/g.43359 Transcript_20634/m.43359 type:complete len:122 (+) Transcript_20634:1653-2018(+)
MHPQIKLRRRFKPRPRSQSRAKTFPRGRRCRLRRCRLRRMIGGTLAEGLAGAISKTKEGRIHTFPLQEADMQVGGALDSSRIPIGKVGVAGDLVVGSVEGACRNTYFLYRTPLFCTCDSLL